MALQAFDLNRAGDTPVATLKLMEITPKNWRRFPPPIANSVPIYIPVITYVGGAFGDDVDVADAASTDAYSPRNQAQKATLMGTTLAVDVARARGPIAPNQPYPTAGSPAPTAPTITALAPNTAVAGGQNVFVKVTGTGFSPWTKLFIGGQNVAYRYAHYVSPTELQIVMDAARSTPGTITVIAQDAGLNSAPSNFTFT